MNLSTIEQGEELLKKFPQFRLDPRDDLPNDTEHRAVIAFLVNHASELLQIAREVEGMKEELQAMQEAFKRGRIEIHIPEGSVIGSSTKP